jgi:hypothetical protein
VRDVAPAGLELRKECNQVVLVPILVGVAEDEIERSGESRYDLMRVAKYSLPPSPITNSVVSPTRSA